MQGSWQGLVPDRPRTCGSPGALPTRRASHHARPPRADPPGLPCAGSRPHRRESNAAVACCDRLMASVLIELQSARPCADATAAPRSDPVVGQRRHPAASRARGGLTRGGSAPVQQQQRPVVVHATRAGRSAGGRPARSRPRAAARPAPSSLSMPERDVALRGLDQPVGEQQQRVAAARPARDHAELGVAISPSTGPSASCTAQRPDPACSWTPGGWPAERSSKAPVRRSMWSVHRGREPLAPVLAQQVVVGGRQERVAPAARRAARRRRRRAAASGTRPARPCRRRRRRRPGASVPSAERDGDDEVPGERRAAGRAEHRLGVPVRRAARASAPGCGSGRAGRPASTRRGRPATPSRVRRNDETRMISPIRKITTTPPIAPAVEQARRGRDDDHQHAEREHHEPRAACAGPSTRLPITIGITSVVSGMTGDDVLRDADQHATRRTAAAPGEVGLAQPADRPVPATRSAPGRRTRRSGAGVRVRRPSVRP